MMSTPAGRGDPTPYPPMGPFRRGGPPLSRCARLPIRFYPGAKKKVVNEQLDRKFFLLSPYGG